MKRQYKNLTLRLYLSMKEYEIEEGIKHVYTDAEGNVCDIRTEDILFDGVESKEHMSDDSTYKPEKWAWEAYTDTEMPGIVGIVLTTDKVVTIGYKELLTTIGHELGHLTDGTQFQNAVASYDTQEGYEQEESRGQAFGQFTEDTHEILELYTEMMNEYGINIT